MLEPKMLLESCSVCTLCICRIEVTPVDEVTTSTVNFVEVILDQLNIKSLSVKWWLCNQNIYVCG
jgi:hypothetical protein